MSQIRTIQNCVDCFRVFEILTSEDFKHLAYCTLSVYSHKYSVFFYNKCWRFEGKVIDPVDYKLVEQITVLILFHRRVEQTGPVLQTEVANPLLDEVKVLLLVVVVPLQVSHVVRLKEMRKDCFQIPARPQKLFQVRGKKLGALWKGAKSRKSTPQTVEKRTSKQCYK